jgi:hypothetical protein
MPQNSVGWRRFVAFVRIGTNMLIVRSRGFARWFRLMLVASLVPARRCGRGRRCRVRFRGAFCAWVHITPALRFMRVVRALDFAGVVRALDWTRIARRTGPFSRPCIMNTFSLDHLVLVLLAEPRRRITVVNPLRSVPVIPATMDVIDGLPFVDDVWILLEVRRRRRLLDIDLDTLRVRVFGRQHDQTARQKEWRDPT